MTSVMSRQHSHHQQQHSRYESCGSDADVDYFPSSQHQPPSSSHPTSSSSSSSPLQQPQQPEQQQQQQRQQQQLLRSSAAAAAALHQSVFQEAVSNGDADRLQVVLEELQHKIDVNGYNRDGQTALHQSCLDGNLDVVKLLVRFGADVRLANRDGWSALHIAAWGGHRDIAMYLINAHTR